MQRRLFINEDDVENLVGQFIIQIDNDYFENTIIQNGVIDPFWVEKRICQVSPISFKHKEDRISGYILTGAFYSHGGLLTKDALIDKINNGNGRHYRLMSSEEVKLYVEQNLKRVIE